MQISLQQASKRFNKEWIFRNLDYTFELGQHYALIGNNGSGKSTLLQIIAGYSSLTKGTIHWSGNDHTTIFQQISFAAPYLELVEEFTTMEQFDFHATFKTLQPSISVNDIIERIGLKNSAHKQIRYFSSGMKQRLKLALAIFDQAPILLLDEPTAGMSPEETLVMMDLIRTLADERTVILVEHKMKLIMGLCNRIIVLHHGEFLAEGTPDEIQNNAEVRRVYLGQG